MIRDVNLLNSGKANRLVPKSEVLSAEATFSSFISLAVVLYCTYMHPYIYTVSRTTVQLLHRM